MVDKRFSQRLKELGLAFGDMRAINTPGSPGLKLEWSVTHGLLAETCSGSRPRWYSAIDIVAPESNLHLIALSDQTAQEWRRKDHFQLVHMTSIHGEGRMPKLQTVWDVEKGKRRYDPRRADRTLRQKRSIAPWLCFTTNPDRPNSIHVMQCYPAMHRYDLRRCVDSPSRNIVVIDDETYVRAWCLHPARSKCSVHGIFERVQNRFLAKKIGPLWARLNRSRYYLHEERIWFAPYQRVVEYGKIERLKRFKNQAREFTQASGVFQPIQSLVLDIPKQVFDKVLEKEMRDTTVVTPINGKPTQLSVADELALRNAVNIRFCPDSVVRFLRYCARRHARVPDKWPGFPFRTILEFIQAVDPDVFAIALAMLESEQLAVRSSLMRIVPSVVPIPWIVTYERIASDYAISQSTARRRAKQLGIAVPQRNGVLRRDYNKHRNSFMPKIQPSVYSSSIKGYRSGGGSRSSTK